MYNFAQYVLSILSLSALHDNGVTYVLCKNLKLHFAVEAQYHMSFMNTYTYLLCEMKLFTLFFYSFVYFSHFSDRIYNVEKGFFFTYLYFSSKY